MDPTVRLVAVLWLLFMFSKLSFAAQLARQDREQRNVEWEQPNLFLSRFWHVLGPFQIGTQG